MLKKAKKTLIFFGILAFVIFIFRGWLFRKSVSYTKTGLRKSIELTDKNLITQLKLEKDNLRLEEIIAIAQKKTNEKLSFASNICDFASEKLIFDSHSVRTSCMHSTLYTITEKMDQIFKLRELEKIGDHQSIKDILFQELRSNSNNINILDFLLEYMDDYEILHKYGEAYINIILELKEGFPQKYKAQLCVLEAKLLNEHQDPQVAWQTLVKGLIHFPSSDEIIDEIESIFDYPPEAPEASDSMEKLGELVAKKEFPKDTFEYLLLICADPEFPEQFDLAKKNAVG